jgi:GT2 family glycosyltransferase
MGRLHHLKVTLPRNIADNSDYPNIEFSVVDYNSPDGLYEWIHDEMAEHLRSGLIRYLRTTEPTTYHFSRAKNMSHQLATGDILCALDADNFTGKYFATYINNVTLEDPKTVGFSNSSKYRGTEGRLFIHRDHFEMLNGYDERFEGYSWEDYDLLERARNSGLQAVVIPKRFLLCIPHGHKERELYSCMSRREGIRKNTRMYRATSVNSYIDMLNDKGCVIEEE